MFFLGNEQVGRGFFLIDGEPAPFQKHVDARRKLVQGLAEPFDFPAEMREFFDDRAGRTADRQMEALEQVFYLP
jgi:hypothetical protein